MPWEKWSKTRSKDFFQIENRAAKMIKGLTVLSISFLLGMWLGDLLGSLFGLSSNVGGVGFAMVFLILAKAYLSHKGYWKEEWESGVDFWNKLYIPVVIALAASLNVKSAVNSGLLAVFAGIIPVIIAFVVLKILIQKSSLKS